MEPLYTGPDDVIIEVCIVDESGHPLNGATWKLDNNSAIPAQSIPSPGVTNSQARDDQHVDASQGGIWALTASAPCHEDGQSLQGVVAIAHTSQIATLMLPPLRPTISYNTPSLLVPVKRTYAAGTQSVGPRQSVTLSLSPPVRRIRETSITDIMANLRSCPRRIATGVPSTDSGIRGGVSRFSTSDRRDPRHARRGARRARRRASGIVLARTRGDERGP
jgi:hypothetical protein